jgi:hypothetical protein
MQTIKELPVATIKFHELPNQMCREIRTGWTSDYVNPDEEYPWCDYINDMEFFKLSEGIFGYSMKHEPGRTFIWDATTNTWKHSPLLSVKF